VPFRLPLSLDNFARDNPRDPCTIFSITTCPRTSQWLVNGHTKIWARNRKEVCS
jgi:hypothetical protein